MSISGIKLISLNIAHGRGPILFQSLVNQKTILKWMGKTATLLREIKPDIVTLQEIDEDSQWNGNLNLIGYLRENSVSASRPMECTTDTTENSNSRIFLMESTQ